VVDIILEAARTYQISRRRLSLDGGPAIRTCSLRSSTTEPLCKALGKVREGQRAQIDRKADRVTTHGVAKCMPTSKAKGFVEGSYANSALQTTSDVIDMPLKRVDKL
jgi:hypothetical protein